MKKFLTIIFTVVLLLGCNKENAPKPIILPIQQLPPPTQVGANTFGCLLDGQVFIPGNTPNPLDSQYQLISGEYYFAIDGAKKFANNDLISIGLGTLKLTIQEGATYQLFAQEDNKANGSFFFNTFISYTSNTNTGEMKITKFDTINQIVSGTFWFDVLDNFGIKHEIREGRFDMRYTM